MTRPIIAIDIDDVLADNAAGFIRYTNDKWGTSLEPDDYEEHWGKVWQTEHDLSETIRRRDELIEAGIYRTYAHDDSALPVLKRLSERFDLHVVTSRLAVMKDGTLEWLDKHYGGIFPPDNVHLAGIWEKVDASTHTVTKADTVRLIEAEYLIDDQLKHCEGAAENGVKALLFGNYKWNETDYLNANIVRVKDWNAVERYFDER